jgi:hypothetical protein
MRLETHEGLFADPATIEDVSRAVAGLTAIGEAFIIVSTTADSEEYVQAAGTVDENFIVERRDGSGAGEHYRADRRLTADELIAMLVGYLRDAPNWSHSVSWHHVRVDFGAANGNA